MQYEENGRIIQGVGGLFEVALDAGDTPLSGGRAFARAKGNFRHAGVTPLPGDRVRLQFDDTAFSKDENGEVCAVSDGGGAVVADILPRKNALIRPPMANLDVLFENDQQILPPNVGYPQHCHHYHRTVLYYHLPMQFLPR